LNELLSKYTEEVQQTLLKYPADRKRSAVMPLLYLAQREDGYITKKGIEDIADVLEMSATDVVSVIGFYTLYHDQPGGRYRIQVCTDLPCALRGADEFLEKLCQNLGIRVGETTSDGLFTIEEVKCLAGCHRAPLFQIQGDGDISYYENQTAETAATLFADLRQKAQGSSQSVEVEK
jgi:NADH-quinone oxidoreductase subunit E